MKAKPKTMNQSKDDARQVFDVIVGMTDQIYGLPMDIRNCPREAQVVAFEKGLIPYIPADRE